MKQKKGRINKWIVAVVMFVLIALLFIDIASAFTLYVPDDYAKIQWAVDNASAGDTIIVRGGTYTENVVVNKQLTIMSEDGSDNCVVQAANLFDHVFSIIANHVNISGFNVKGAGADIYVYATGTHLHLVDYCNISNNNCLNNGIGILLNYSNNNRISNNYCSNNKGGLVLRESNNNSIFDNNCSNNDASIHVYYSKK